jgi:hypothetical protein
MKKRNTKYVKDVDAFKPRLRDTFNALQSLHASIVLRHDYTEANSKLQACMTVMDAPS